MSDKLTEVQVVRIICDEVLKERLFAHLHQLGATGWTWWLTHGKGEHPTDAGFFSEIRQLYIEVWCHSDIAEKIMDYCNSSHFEGIGMSVGISPLLVSPHQARGLQKH